jgi:hypothetical protein
MFGKMVSKQFFKERVVSHHIVDGSFCMGANIVSVIFLPCARSGLCGWAHPGKYVCQYLELRF